MATKKSAAPVVASEPEAPVGATYYGFAIVRVPLRGAGVDAEHAESNALVELRKVLPPGAVITESVLGAPPSPTGP